MAHWHAWIAALAAAAPATEGVSKSWTLEDVLERARLHAPAILDARAALGEAEARLAGAGPLLDSNPEIEAAAGRRSGAAEPDLEIGLTQGLDLAGRRGLRRASGRAGLERAQAMLDLATRQALADAAGAFYRLLHAQERLALARAAEETADELRLAVQKRYDAGDVAALDLNLAKIAAGRARTETASAQADRSLREGELRAAIAMGREPMTIVGDLRRRSMDPRALEAAEVEARPEVTAAAADVRHLEAERRVARRSAWPDVGLTARFEREEGTSVAWGGLSLSLPLFQRGQEERATAEARLARARAALGATRGAVEAAAHADVEAYRARLEAVRWLEELVLPGVEDNEGLARRSFEVGEIGVSERLLVRREGLEARAVHLDALLAAALAEVQWLSRTGGLR